MDGVTILNEVVVSDCIPIGIMIIILSLVMAGLSVYIGVICIKESSMVALIFPIITLLLSVFFFCSGISIINKPTYNKYEVTISDEVSFKDFTNKYEVIEQRGEIYVVKER